MLLAERQSRDQAADRHVLWADPHLHVEVEPVGRVARLGDRQADRRGLVGLGIGDRRAEHLDVDIGMLLEAGEHEVEEAQHRRAVQARAGLQRPAHRRPGSAQAGCLVERVEAVDQPLLGSEVADRRFGARPDGDLHAVLPHGIREGPSEREPQPWFVGESQEEARRAHCRHLHTAVGREHVEALGQGGEVAGEEARHIACRHPLPALDEPALGRHVNRRLEGGDHEVVAVCHPHAGRR